MMCTANAHLLARKGDGGVSGTSKMAKIVALWGENCAVIVVHKRYMVSQAALFVMFGENCVQSKCC